MVLLEKTALPLGLLVNVPSLLPAARGPELGLHSGHRGLRGDPAMLEVTGPMGMAGTFAVVPQVSGPSGVRCSQGSPSSW